MTFYGPEVVTNAQIHVVKSGLNSIEGVQYYGREDVSEDSYLHSWGKTTAGIPVESSLHFSQLEHG